MADSDEWYYVSYSGEQAGPATTQDLKGLFSSQEVTGDTMMWCEGMFEWTCLNDIPALKSKICMPHQNRGPPAPPPGRNGPPAPPGGQNPNRTSLRFGYGQAPLQPSNRPQSGRMMNQMSASNNWVEKFTADGMAYYYNPSSEAVSWDKPDSLKTAEELESDSGEWVWVSDDIEAFVPGRVISRSGRSVTVQLRTGGKKSVDPNNEPLWPLTLSSLTRLEDDLVMVDSINQGLMMYCLKERYKNDQIYTWVGANHTVLVSVNPFKQLPIYTVNVMNDFRKPSPNRMEPPHTFAIANNAYLHLKLDSEDQAILISGESGAGKTECTKQCLSFLAEVAGSDTNVEQKILNANPVLESFGNAKTLRNNNSSRFGRWMIVNFDNRRYTICGCRIENYLLEKCRVVYQQGGERSFHIFYQLCFSNQASQLNLGPPESFRYLGQSGCTTVPGIDDLQDFNDVKSAFNTLNFSQQDQDWVFNTCAGILHCGNITFGSQGEGSTVDHNGRGALEQAAYFLECPPDSLAQALTNRSMEVRGEVTYILNRPQEALEAADALSKAVYNKLFDWLVQRINQSVQGASGVFIGVLDIFGFEIFEVNSFEQLCINFTNEKLQQHFNKHTFKEEEETYISEGIQYERVPFIDNQPVLDLIEKKPYGLLNLLDEEVKLPKGTDQKWLNKVDSNHSAHPNWMSDEGMRTQISATDFIVCHYAGTVIYSCLDFVEKNRDSLFRDIYDLLSNSNAQITRGIFPPKDKNPRRLETVGAGFRKQLNNLMQVLDLTEPHYIRCVKPNHDKAPNRFQSQMCLEQLTYAGVFEAVQIRKGGFPFRLTHQRFACRYRPLARKEHGWLDLGVRDGDWRSMSQALLGCVNQDFSAVQIGHTMVLYRADEYRILELLRNLTLDRVIPVAQRATRKAIGRNFRRTIPVVNNMCYSALQSFPNDVPRMEQEIQRATDIMGPFTPIFHYTPHGLQALKDRRFKMEERVRLTDLFRELIHKDPDRNYGDFVDAVKRADVIADMPGTAEEMQLEQQVRDLLASSAGAKLDPWAEEALYLLDKEQMQLVSDEAFNFSYSTPDLEEIRRLLEVSEEEFVKLQLKRANEMGDPERIINREVRLKELYLDVHGPLFRFEKCSTLRDPLDWACSRFFGLAMNKEEIAAGMLVFSSHPIHESLHDLPPQINKEAVKQFKNIMGWMGDRKYQYPDTLAQEVLATGITMAELRTELYSQLMKQIMQNPNRESQDKGWELMALMLSSFPPPDSFENFLAYFIREHGPFDKKSQFTSSMHSIIYGGARTNPPSLADINILISEFFRRPVTARFTAQDILAVRNQTGMGQQETKTPYGGGGGGGGGFGNDPYGGGGMTQEQQQFGFGSRGGGGGPPVPPPQQQQSDSAMVMFDYNSGGQEGMLDVRKGDLVNILDKFDNLS